MVNHAPQRPSAETAPSDQRHSPRGRFNAWFFDTFNGYIDVISHRHKCAVFADIVPGRILEIGAGTGANFTYVPIGSTVIALEPNAAMHARLGRRASELDIDLELLAAPAEAIPLDDDSVDTVISTLVLCTVRDPDQVLDEIRRVLRPGGTLRFVEHVAAQPASPRRWLQQAIRRPWAWIWEGCQLCRDTAAAVERAGFSSVETHRRRLRWSVFIPINTAIHGIATK